MCRPDRGPVRRAESRDRDMPNVGRYTHDSPALRTARPPFPPPSVIFGNVGPILPGITSFALGLLHIGQLIMYSTRAFTRYTLPNTPYPLWTHLLPLSMNQ